MAETTPLLELRDVELAYGEEPILEEISLAIRPGDCLGLVGPNGSGKTTLLRALLGALEPRAGQVFRDRALATIGYVPQRHGLDPCFPLRVLDVVVMGRYGRIPVGRRPGAADRERSLQALEQVGLDRLAGSPYRDLSGGQQQRALIARALAADSPLLLLDEPTTGMDLPSEAEIMGLIRGLHEREGLTVVLVSHELELVAAHATTMALLRGGRLHAGPTDEILTEERLCQAYGVPVEVTEVSGRRLVRIREQGA